MFSYIDPGAGRPINGYLRRQTILVGVHKLLHDAPKMPLFVLIPDAICDTCSLDRPLRIVPLGLKNLILHNCPLAQNTEGANDTRMGNTPVPSFVSPAPQSSSTSLSPPNELSPVSTIQEDSQSDNISSLTFTTDMGSRSIHGTESETSNSSPHEINSGFVPKQEAEMKGLAVMSMDINDPWEGDKEIKVVLPRDQSGRGPFCAPFDGTHKPEQIVITMNSIDATTQSSLVIEIQEPDVRLPGILANWCDAIAHKSPRSVTSDNPKEFSPVVHALATRDNLPGNTRRDTVHTSPTSPVSSRWRQIVLQEEKVNSADRGANVSSQNMDANIPEIERVSYMSTKATSPPPRYSLLQDESMPLSISHPPAIYQSHGLSSNHKASKPQTLPFPYIPSQEAEMFSFDLSPPRSQVTALLTILNASSIPYIKPSVLEPARGISCLHDPPIVKLAPIGSPTARPTRSSYAWGRAESSCGSTPTTSPLSSPCHSAQQRNEISLPWPPAITGSSFDF